MPSSSRSNVPWPTTFKVLKSHLAREALAARNVPLFAAAQARQPALARHAGAASILGVLNGDTSCHAAARESVVRALIEEYQLAPGPFWSSILVLGFLPLLGAIRDRLADPGIPDDELTSIVVTSFLEVVSELDVGNGSRLTALRLRQKTARRVYQVVNGERAARDVERAFAPAADDTGAEEEWRWPGTPAGAVPADDVVTEMAVDLLHDWAGPFMPAAHLDLVAETVVRGTRLWDYVDRLYPRLPLAARLRAYQRTKRLRTRAMLRLRRLLSAVRVPKNGGHGS